MCSLRAAETVRRCRCRRPSSDRIVRERHEWPGTAEQGDSTARCLVQREPRDLRFWSLTPALLLLNLVQAWPYRYLATSTRMHTLLDMNCKDSFGFIPCSIAVATGAGLPDDAGWGVWASATADHQPVLRRSGADGKGRALADGESPKRLACWHNTASVQPFGCRCLTLPFVAAGVEGMKP
eukprot:SAG31_NODE_1248_length_9126_cov_5.023928_6_plen_181_part_00